MKLPTGKEKDNLIKSGAEREKLIQIEVENLKKKHEKEKLEEERRNFLKKVTEVKERIKEYILDAMNSGKREVSIINSYNASYQEAWDKAVKDIKKENTEYSFDILKYRILCDNACEAYNVDGVSFRTWMENVEELKVTW